MGRKHHHEEHVNHEAWAIPYGDLVTLLLAFFVVMYAISSINEGKYRVMADALASAFGGTPRTIAPVRVGQTQLQGSNFDRPSVQTSAAKVGPAPSTPVSVTRVRQVLDVPNIGRYANVSASRETTGSGRDSGRGSGSGRDSGTVIHVVERERQLNSLGRRIQEALSKLVAQNLVTVRRGRTFLEVEIQSDILFASGSAIPSTVTTSTVRKLATVLREEPNAVRVEGYTDDQPIRTALFHSNWELSAARAASVVHVMADEGVAEHRLAVLGFGEHQPVADNGTEAGRNANRRVLLVILAAPDGPDAVPDDSKTVPFEVQPDAAATGPAGAGKIAPTRRATGAVAPSSKPAARAPQTGNGSAAQGYAKSPAAPQPGAG